MRIVFLPSIAPNVPHGSLILFLDVIIKQTGLCRNKSSWSIWILQPEARFCVKLAFSDKLISMSCFFDLNSLSFRSSAHPSHGVCPFKNKSHGINIGQTEGPDSSCPAGKVQVKWPFRPHSTVCVIAALIVLTRCLFPSLMMDSVHIFFLQPRGRTSKQWYLGMHANDGYLRISFSERDIQLPNKSPSKMNLNKFISDLDLPSTLRYYIRWHLDSSPYIGEFLEKENERSWKINCSQNPFLLNSLTRGEIILVNTVSPF